MSKKILVILALIIAAVAAVAAVIFIYRYQILQYSAEMLIRKNLPDYVKIDTIRFDFKDGRVSLGGFKILNPGDFSYKYLLEIDEITCLYRMRGKNITDGLDIAEPVFKKAVLSIERLGDGRLNLIEMQNVTGAGKTEARAARPNEGSYHKTDKDSAPGAFAGRSLADIIKLPATFLFKDGKVIFVDRFNSARPHLITFERVDAEISLAFDSSYSRILDLKTKGGGRVNGNKEEVIRWVTAFNPTTPRLTMSNRFEISNVDLVSFEPYYDKYSPLVFKKGRFSGTLIFDFDNGSIGSTNEIRLNDFVFYIKRGFENAQFWETTVPDIVKYLSSSFGEIIFDFKIKGDMENPKFYLGPISKQAIASMAIDKISGAIQQMSDSAGGSTGSPKNDIEKAKEYIDLFKGLMNKK